MKEKKDTTEEKVIDASGKTLGRVASVAAAFLIGKHNTSYQRNVYSGSRVKVVNASKLRINAKKLEEVFHTRYSGYPGGLRILKGTEIAEKKGLKEVIKISVFGMLPKNKLKKSMMKSFKIED